MNDETLTHLRNALGQRARAQPEQRKLRRPSRDEVGEFVIVTTAALTAAQFTKEHAPVLRGTAAASKTFKPAKEIAWAEVDATFRSDDLPDAVISKELRKGVDIVDIELAELNFGGVDCFKNWPVKQEGRTDQPEHQDCCDNCKTVRTGEALTLAAFSNDSLGCGIGFPPCDGSVSAAFRVNPGFLAMLEGFAPAGYEKTPTSIRLAIHIRMLGPALR